MSERFVVKDGVVTDTKTGLQWEAEHHGPMSWDEAQEYAKSLRLCGHDDWRVPNLEELIMLIDFSKSGPASAFPGMPSAYFWSSSSYSGSASSAWVVFFNFGYVSNFDKTTSINVRCIRRGPVDPSGLRPFDERLEKIEKRLDVLERMQGVVEELDALRVDFAVVRARAEKAEAKLADLKMHHAEVVHDLQGKLEVAEARVVSLRTALESFAERDCDYGDGCPAAGTRHGRCVGCLAREALAEPEEVKP